MENNGSKIDSWKGEMANLPENQFDDGTFRRRLNPSPSNPMIDVMEMISEWESENESANSKLLIDTVVIGKRVEEIRLMKDKQGIKLALMVNGKVEKAYGLDSSDPNTKRDILDGTIGMSGEDLDPWSAVLNRLPGFFEYINSE